MKNRIFRAGLILAFLSISLLTVFAQSNGSNGSSGSGRNNSYIKAYNTGEVLTYEGKFSKIIKGIAIADLSFTVENAPDNQGYLIKSEARSKGTLAKLFRFTFLQQMQSMVDGDDLSVLRSTKHDVQNERVRDSEAVFDYSSKRVTYVETDPKDAMRPPRKVASQIEPTTQDIISGIYLLRQMPLAVGKTFEMLVSDSGLFYKIPVRVTARERQKTVLGKVWCFRIEPEVFGENRLIDNHDGSLIIWITDDTRRIPVRGQINASIGRVEVKLKSVGYKPTETEAKK